MQWAKGRGNEMGMGAERKHLELRNRLGEVDG